MKFTIKLKKFFRIIKNIFKNLRKKIEVKIVDNNLINFVNRYKLIIAVAIAITLFIGKNIYLITRYSSDISHYKTSIKNLTAENKQLEEDLKYYNTDEFVYRYAMSELNMRPTKPSNLVHVEILPVKKDEAEEEENSSQNDSNDNSISENESSNSNTNEDNSQESTNMETD